ncbi:MAG TPA: hypothetical protein VK786_07360 [bacterium]|nr:hypothetical protein [bacterium]
MKAALKNSVLWVQIVAFLAVPAAPLFAADAVPAPAPSAAADSGAAGASSALTDTAQTDAAPLPNAPLPDVSDAHDDGQSAENKDNVQPQVSSRHLFADFLLGFLGGALVGGAYSFLFYSNPKNPNSPNIEARDQQTALYGGIGALGFGTVAVLFGLTTPQQVGPPQSSMRHTVPGLQVAMRF